MGPGSELGSAQSAREQELLMTIAAEFPGLEVRYLHGGFAALPKGTPVTSAANLETLLRKLRGNLR